MISGALEHVVMCRLVLCVGVVLLLVTVSVCLE